MTGAGTADGSAPRRRILVVTVVHHPSDSRIRHREITALLAAGWEVTYAAPFSGYDTPLETDVPGLTCLDLPRAHGRRRFAAGRAARDLLRRHGGEYDIVLVHDPELLLAATGLGLDHLVWDVHEDPAAALAVKDWMPGPLRGVGAAAWRRIERVAERRWPLLLAEHAYQERFGQPHPVVPNTVRVPADVPPADLDSARVVYLGSVTLARGCAVMVDLARLLREASGGAITVEVIGPAKDDASAELLRAASAEGLLTAHGFVPSDRALAMLDGALCGLSLLADLPNYRPSMPTKALEYLAHGVPVVTTPLPLAAELAESSGAGLVVPFDDAQAAADAVLHLWHHRDEAARMGRAGHAFVAQRYDWTQQGPAFVAHLESLASSAE